MKIIAFVPIKLNNERLNNKNILPLGNYPLCHYIFNTLKQVKYINDIYVFCSDNSIINYIPPDIKFLKRTTDLDNNYTLGIDIYKSFVNIIKADIYILAHATSPFISVSSIEKGIEALLYNNYDSSFSVKELKTYAWFKNTPINYDINNIVKTQDLNPILIETSAFYIFTKNIIENNKRIGTNPFKVLTNNIESIDIDDLDDYNMAKYVINYNNIINHIPHKHIHFNNIKLVVLDYDGTLSDGKIYIDNTQHNLKCYNVKDGYALNRLKNLNINVVIISGNSLDFFISKAIKLNIELHGNIDNKLNCLNKIAQNHNINLLTETIYMGDDDNDFEIINEVAFFGCPNNASTRIKQYSNFISKFNGGEGAVRDFIDYIFL